MVHPILVDALFRDEVARARAMRPEDKLLEGPRLFDRTCRIICDGIRHQQPALDEPSVQRLLRERLTLAESLERQ